MAEWQGMGGNDLSLFYKRLAEIKQLAQTDPDQARTQMELLMQDYPGMIEDMQGRETAGRTLMSEGFDVAPALRGPTQNPFAYDTINIGGHIANAGKMYFGNKMATDAAEGIQLQRDLQREERIKMGEAGMGDPFGVAEDEERQRQRMWSYWLRNRT